jgi:hypothetical protein
MGGSEHVGNIDLLSPQQSNFLSQSLSGNNAYGEFLQPYNQEAFGDLFQKSFIDPSLQALQRQIIPGLKESFLGLDESGSGSLNRALAQAASDVSTGLGKQYMNFYNQQQQNKLGALGQLGGLAGQRTFEPHIQQIQGILAPFISALGQAGAGFAKGGGVGAGIGALSSLLGNSGGLADTIQPGPSAGPYGQVGNTYNPYTGVQGPYQPWRGF